MSKLIFVTVGTSALNNFGDLKDRGFGDVDELCDALHDEAENGENGENEECEHQKTHITGLLEDELVRFYENGSQDFQSLTAELGSLMAMDRQIETITNGDRIVLLHSDTADGRLCAEVHAQVIKCKVRYQVDSEVKERTICSKVEVERVEGLQVVDAAKFKSGLVHLRDKVKSFSGPYAYYFNITGGFKALIPYATALALDADLPMDVVYLFEKSQQLIVIKQSDLSIEQRSNGFEDLIENTFIPN